MQQEEVAEERHGGGDAHHGLTHEGKDDKKGHKLRVEMEHVDLIVLEHHFEEGGEGRKQAGPEGGISVTAGAMLERDAGQAGVSPHSLKLEASMGRTLPMASSLST